MTTKPAYTLHSEPPNDREYRRIRYAGTNFYLADYGDISPNMLIDMFRKLVEVETYAPGVKSVTLRMIMYDQNNFEIGRNVTEHLEYQDWRVCNGDIHHEATHMATLLPGEVTIHRSIGEIAVYADTREKYEILAHLHHQDDEGTYFYAVRKVPDAAAPESNPFIAELHPITDLQIPT